MLKYKGVGVELNDGATYVFPPLTLGYLEANGDALGALDPASKEGRGAMIDAAFASARRNYPDLTREALLELIDLSNMVDVFEAVMDVSGLKRKAQETGAGEALGAAA